MSTGVLTRIAGALLFALLATACGGNDPSLQDSSTSTPSATVNRITPASSSGSPSASAVASSSDATTIEVTIAGGKVSGVDRRVTVTLGGKVRLVVTSDVDDVVHVHVYDEKLDISPSGPATLEFTADIPGSFEVELEDAGLDLFQLRVA